MTNAEILDHLRKTVKNFVGVRNNNGKDTLIVHKGDPDGPFKSLPYPKDLPKYDWSK